MIKDRRQEGAFRQVDHCRDSYSGPRNVINRRTCQEETNLAKRVIDELSVEVTPLNGRTTIWLAEPQRQKPKAGPQLTTLAVATDQESPKVSSVTRSRLVRSLVP